ncbi:unnamed protein product [Peniophora sp. CBMAI 1063]|nr:unnamed protein product [Peniophora sp. CBMAI 1063]
MVPRAELLLWVNLHLVSIIAETFIYGIYSVLFFLSLIKLIRSGPGGPGNNLRSLIFPSAILMFCIATSHFVLLLQQNMSSNELDQGAATLGSGFLPWYGYTEASLEIANCLIGDIVMISIAITLGDRPSRSHSSTGSRLKLYAVPAVLLTASLIAGMGTVLSSAGVDILSNATNPHLRGFTIAWMALILATNLVSTSLFIYEISSRRREYKERMLASSDKPFNALLFTLTCCGLLYCCTFAILLVLFLTDIKACWVMNHMIPQLAGIYPISTIVVVAVRKFGASQARPILPAHSRQLSDMSFRSTRGIGFASPMSASSLPNASRSTIPSSPIIPPASPTNLSGSTSRLSRKLVKLRRFSRKGPRFAVAPRPTGMLIKVHQTVQHTFDDLSISRTFVSSMTGVFPSTLPEHRLTSSIARPRTTINLFSPGSSCVKVGAHTPAEVARGSQSDGYESEDGHGLVVGSGSNLGNTNGSTTTVSELVVDSELPSSVP